MFWYIYFILIFKFDIIVKVYGNSPANVIDYIIQYANNKGMKYVREENDMNTNNKNDTAQNNTKTDENDVATTKKLDTAQNNTKTDENDMKTTKKLDTAQNNTKTDENDVNTTKKLDTAQNDTKNEVNDSLNTTTNDTNKEENDMNTNNKNDTAQNETKKEQHDLVDHDHDNLDDVDNEGEAAVSGSEPDFEPYDAIANITSDQIFSVMANSDIFNEIVEEQTIFTYGSLRAEKYQYVANAVWVYFRSILGRRPIVTLPTPKNPLAGCTVKTLGPVKDYLDSKEFASTNDGNSTQQQNQTLTPTNATINLPEKKNSQENITKSTNFTTTPTNETSHQPKTKENSTKYTNFTTTPTNQTTHQPKTKENSTGNTDTTTTHKLEIQRTLDQLSTTNLPDTLNQPKLKSNKLPIRRGAVYLSTYKPDQHQPQTQYPSIKSPNQRDQDYPSTWPGHHDVQYLSTSSQQLQYLKILPDQQETQLTPTEKIRVDAIRQRRTLVQPAYYDFDATTVSGGRVPPRRNSLIFGMTKLPQLSTEHPIVKNVRTRMVSKKQGYFTAFVQELCTIIAVKNPFQSKKLYRALQQVISKMIHQQGRLAEMGIGFQTAITAILRTLTALEPDVIQSYASIAVNALDEKDVAADVQSLLHNLDDIYSFQEGEEVLNTLVQVYEYPKNGSALVVAESVVEKVFSPYLRLSRRRQFLIQSIYNVMEKRNLGRRRHKEDLDRMFVNDYRKKNNGNRDFNEEIISKDKNGKVTKSFTKLNAIEMNNAKELIKNFKVKEFIKKYETPIARVTAKSWSNIYKIYEKSSDFRKRHNFEKIQPNNEEESNSFSSETLNINYDSQTVKMADIGNTKNKNTIKEVIDNYKAIKAIKFETTLFQVTAKPWSNFHEIHVKSSNFKIMRNQKNRQTTDKDKTASLDNGVMKHKVKTKKHELKSKKVSRNNIYSELDIETDQLSVSECESVSKTHRNKMDENAKRKIRNHLIRKHAKLTESSKKHHEINNRRQTNVKIKALRQNKGQQRFSEVKKSYEEPTFKDKIRARDDERPSYNVRHSNEENRRLPGNRRHHGGKSRPPGANRRPSDSITRNPAANQQPSMYLTPRYEYNSRRFNENLNLTRRSNAKPISTELSYSYEENDIKFYIQDAIRHPIDLKSKIQQNSLKFDKVQNGRRQMAPVDRIRLRHESSYSDDELTIKNNIYKVFNKNN